MPAPLRIGIDFDNTIVCYDQAIALLSKELFDLPPEVPLTKLGLRNYLRNTGQEHEWVAFQGELYGPGMLHAQPFKGAVKTMCKLLDSGHDLMIISHRSLRPYAGHPHDLHRAAQEWVVKRLQSAGLFRDKDAKRSVNFLETREKKVAMIKELGCQAFLDDLPEVLSAPGFPRSTAGIYFAPAYKSATEVSHLQISAWEQLPEILAQLP